MHHPPALHLAPKCACPSLRDKHLLLVPVLNLSVSAACCVIPCCSQLKKQCTEYNEWTDLTSKRERLKRVLVANDYTECRKVIGNARTEVRGDGVCRRASDSTSACGWAARFSAGSMACHAAVLHILGVETAGMKLERPQTRGAHGWSLCRWQRWRRRWPSARSSRAGRRRSWRRSRARLRTCRWGALGVTAWQGDGNTTDNNLLWWGPQEEGLGRNGTLIRRRGQR